MVLPSQQDVSPLTGAPTSESAVARGIGRVLVQEVGRVAQAAGATAIFVYADAVEQPLSLPEGLKARVVRVVRECDDRAHHEAEHRDNGNRSHRQSSAALDDRQNTTITVPAVPLSRIGQVKMAVFLALARGLVKPGEVVVCLSGPALSGLIDTLIVTEVGMELEKLPLTQQLPDSIQPEVLDRVLDLATELGSEGREGRPVGTLFVLGDSTRVMALSTQLILNPFHGHPETERNILDPRLKETIKELSSLDGAFIIRGDGVIVSAGALVKMPTLKDHHLPAGLGARHHAAAGITAAAPDAIAIVISQSTGTVTVFRGGRIICEIDRRQTRARTSWWE